jgi:single-strand DNA-binding protein
MNSVCIVGRVGTDIELKAAGQGKVATFRLAISEGKDKTTWLTVSAWDKSAELLEAYVRKGDQVGIEGRISVREYQDKQGEKRTATEVIANRITLVGGKRDEAAPAPARGGYGGGR